MKLICTIDSVDGHESYAKLSLGGTGCESKSKQVLGEVRCGCGGDLSWFHKNRACVS